MKQQYTLKPVSIEGVVPVFDNELFRSNAENRFATMGLGFGMFPDRVDEDIFANYLRLRKNVYVDQKSMLPKDGHYPNGMEYDEDDRRSSHVAVFENMGDGRVATVACMRVVHRREGSKDPLCIEESLGFVAPEDSGEASRYIVAEASKVNRLRIRDRIEVNSRLFDAMVAIFYAERLAPIYGLIEPPVERALRRSGAPPTHINAPQSSVRVGKFGGTEHVGVVIDIPEMRRVMQERLGSDALQLALLAPGQAQFWGSINSDLSKHGK